MGPDNPESITGQGCDKVEWSWQLRLLMEF